MKSVSLQLFDGYAIYGPTDIISGDVLFGFDLDHTIIKPLKGTFYKTTTDWEFVPEMDIRLKFLHKIAQNNGTIAVFTNQGGVAAGKVTIAEVIARIDAVMRKLGFPFMAFIALSEQYRKPSPLLFEELIYKYMPDYKGGFYCGDASGFEDEFSDSDYRFALNCGLKYVPISSFTSLHLREDTTLESLQQILSVGVLTRPLLIPSVREYITPGAILPKPDLKLGLLVLLIGPPGCGKSGYAEVLAGEGYTVVSRDTAKNGKSATAVQCLGVVKKLITAGLKDKKKIAIVMDATHPDVKSREPFITLALGMGIIPCAVVFNVSINVAKYINKVRTINGGNHVPDIAYGVFAKRFTPPTVDEGFRSVLTVSQIPQDVNKCPDSYFDLYL
jgi:DNA 3'-phosphatase